MNLFDHLQLGPFRHTYHRELADDAFRDALGHLLERDALPQLDEPIKRVEGTLTALHETDVEVVECLSMRNKFRLELVFHCAAGTSELETDLAYDPAAKSFEPWDDPRRPFYVWTPRRKQRRREEAEAIGRLIDDVDNRRPYVDACPICGGELSICDTAYQFHIDCSRSCFQRRKSVDGQGNFTVGSFHIQHPMHREPPVF